MLISLPRTNVHDSDSLFPQYTLRIFPSEDLESQYLTNRPALFAGVVAAVFVFTSMVFFVYNVLVERRQRVVVDRAVRSSVVVSSLFPKTVKEQLINDTVGVADKKKGKKSKRRLNSKPDGNRAAPGTRDEKMGEEEEETLENLREHIENSDFKDDFFSKYPHSRYKIEHPP